MGIKLVRDVLLRRPALDVLILHLLNDIDGVFADGLQRSHNTSILDRPSRTNEGHKVGEVRDP